VFRGVSYVKNYKDGDEAKRLVYVSILTWREYILALLTNRKTSLSCVVITSYFFLLAVCIHRNIVHCFFFLVSSILFATMADKSDCEA